MPSPLGARHVAGLANSSGLVGRYMAGHRGGAFVELPMRLLPGMYFGHSLISKYFQRPTVAGGPGLHRGFMRHDFRVWESTAARAPPFATTTASSSWAGSSWLDWRARTATGTAGLRGYYDIVPDRTAA